MPHLEPTYLRYIYDGLVRGNIHPENAAELPDGLIGMYEEAVCKVTRRNGERSLNCRCNSAVERE